MMDAPRPDRRPGRQLAALFDFLQAESAGGVALILSAAAALLWANSRAAPAYDALLQFPLASRDVRFWVNDGLMAVFFLLVGLELRREITQGELASPGRLAAPAIAAIGGMIVPAVVFSAFNYQDREAMRGWAVPVATDIAFALAVLSVLGRRVPIGLTVFLTALAIIDDLGAIIVIALFYSYRISLAALAAALFVFGVLWGLNRIGVRPLAVYLLGGVLLWLFVLRSGVHATLSGVALAFVIPAQPGRAGGTALALRLERSLEPFVAYVVLPLFGLANAGLRFDALPRGALLQPLVLGIAVALVLGKQVGVFSAVMLADRLKLASLPGGVTRLQLYGASVLCGIGFTMSLFIGDLAFRGSLRQDEVRLAVFVASVVSATCGLSILAFARARMTPTTEP